MLSAYSPFFLGWDFALRAVSMKTTDKDGERRVGISKRVSWSRPGALSIRPKFPKFRNEEKY